MLKNQSHNSSILSSKQLKRINLFCIGFIIYIGGYILSNTSHVKFQICGAIQLIGLGLFIPAAIGLIEFKFENTYLQKVYIFYLLWMITIIMRGVSFDFLSVKTLLFDASYGILIYVIPLILLFPKELIFYKKVFELVIISGILYIIYDIVFIKDLLFADTSDAAGVFRFANSVMLSIPIFFLLLTYTYHSQKIKILTVLIVAITLFFSIIWARRALVFICFSQVICSYLIYLSQSRKKLFIIYSTLLILIVGIGYVSNIYLQKKNNIFSYLLERGEEDTRTGVELYFYNDMDEKSWIIGKGINGQYYCPDIDQNDITDYRDTIETGYLQIILKGGIISMGLLLFITIPAIFLGLFYSKNNLSKAAGLWILLWVLYLYPITMEAFSLYYLLLWICIGICYSKKIRKVPELDIKSFFGL